MLRTGLMWIAIAGAGAMLAAAAADSRDWLYPPGPHGGARKWDATQKLTLAGATGAFTEAEIHDTTAAVDWRPAEHPPLPTRVAHAPPGQWACGYCHLPDGEGRPENASLAGLPARYITRQIQAFRNGTRRNQHPGWFPGDTMAEIAKTLTAEEVQAAARYFSQRPFTSRVRVVEGDMAPKATPAFYVYKVDSAQSAALGLRIVETPASIDGFERRDSHTAYTAYVPAGAVARGAALARTGGPNAKACASCHGFGLRGGTAPPLAGRSPTFIVRQLVAFQSGGRRSPEAADMRLVTAKLSDAQMIDLAAYAATLKP